MRRGLRRQLFARGRSRAKRTQNVYRRTSRRLVLFEPLEDRRVLAGPSLDSDGITPVPPSSAYPGLFQFNDTDRWNATATNGGGLGQGDPTTLTWSFVPDGTSISGGVGAPASGSNLIAFVGTIYGVTTNDSNYTDEPWFSLFESYLNRWGDPNAAKIVAMWRGLRIFATSVA